MIELLRQITKKDLQIFFLLVFSMSLVFSKYLLSVSFFMLGVLCLLEINGPSKRLGFNQKFFRQIIHFFKTPQFYLIAFIFLAFFISGINSENTDHWMVLLRRNIPYVALPLVFFILPGFDDKLYKDLLYFFFWIMFFSSIWVSLNYALNYQEMTFNIGYAKPIPTPIDHIRYSLFLSFSSIIGIILYLKNHFYKIKGEKIFLAIAIIWMIAVLHFLSVRSGLICFYAALITLIFFYIIKAKRYKTLWLIIPIIIISPIIAVNTIPSLKSKLGYSIYDFNKWKSGEGLGYSDSGRIRSITTGLDIWKDQPFLGIGFGDLKDEVYTQSVYKYGSDYKVLMPHNQWVLILAGSGILGLLLFGIGFFMPIVIRSAYKDEFLFFLGIILFVSFLVEATITRSYSIGFHLYFLLLSLRYQLDPKRELPV